MTIAKPPPTNSSSGESKKEESIIVQQALYCMEDNHDVIFHSPITLQLISSICNNIVSHPSEEKFRKIKTSNPKFSEYVMNVEGAVNLLILCGFEIDDSGEYIILKKENLSVQDLKDLIFAIEINVKSSPVATSSSGSGSSSSSNSSRSSSSTVKSNTSASDAEMEERKKKMLEEKKKIQAEKDKIKQQLQADKEERKHLPSGVCSRKTTKPTASATKTFKDLGVDVNRGGG